MVGRRSLQLEHSFCETAAMRRRIRRNAKGIFGHLRLRGQVREGSPMLIPSRTGLHGFPQASYGSKLNHQELDRRCSSFPFTTHLSNFLGGACHILSTDPDLSRKCSWVPRSNMPSFWKERGLKTKKSESTLDFYIYFFRTHRRCSSFPFTGGSTHLDHFFPDPRPTLFFSPGALVGQLQQLLCSSGFEASREELLKTKLDQARREVWCHMVFRGELGGLFFGVACMSWQGVGLFGGRERGWFPFEVSIRMIKLSRNTRAVRETSGMPREGAS